MANNYSANSKFKLESIVVEEAGISSVRNAILDHCFNQCEATFCVMVDDDELVSSNWLNGFLALYKETDADLIGGLKVPLFEMPPESWMINSDVFFYQPYSESGRCNRLVSTDNLFLTQSFYIKQDKPEFDLSFNLTGGGDTEFLERVKRSGARLAFATEALSYEYIPIARMNLQWAKDRSYRIGVGLARTYLLHFTRFEVLLQIIKLISIMLISSTLCLVFIRNKKSNVFFYLTFLKQKGKLESFFGKRVFPYKKRHNDPID